MILRDVHRDNTGNVVRKRKRIVFYVFVIVTIVGLFIEYGAFLGHACSHLYLESK